MANPPVTSFPKLDKPILMFSMQLDDSPNLNYGRMFLLDYDRGYIHKWICTSGTGAYQRIGSWSKQRGGVCPSNDRLKPNLPWFKLIPKIYHGSIVKEGFLIEPNTITTDDGVVRSEIMAHEDIGDDGSYGCWVFPRGEWVHFRDTIIHTCGHHDYVRSAVGYTW